MPHHGLPPSGFARGVDRERVGQEKGFARGVPGAGVFGAGFGAGAPGAYRAGVSDRSDAALSSITMLVLDCDVPAPTAGVCRALRELSIAFCLTPTWSSTVERPKWRLFVPIAPIPTDLSSIGRVRTRLRYAWIAGLVAELGGLPRECPGCGGSGTDGSGGTGACVGCDGTGDFSFDLTCWNYSRLHFLGGRRSEDVPMLGREVRWARGLALDVNAWLDGSEWSVFWEAALPTVNAEIAGDVLRGGDDTDEDGDVTSEAHLDPVIGAAMLRCRVPLYERVRRACSYVGSPSFPPSVSGSRGHDALMRAASVVCSGFLVPLGSGSGAGGDAGSEGAWAERVLEVAFNPRCSPPWQHRDLARKVRQVRASASQEPGSMLMEGGGRGRAGGLPVAVGGQVGGAGLVGSGVVSARCYIVGGQLCGSTGRPLGVADPDVLELFRDAARSCTLDPYDPVETPAGFRVVLGPALARR